MNVLLNVHCLEVQVLILSLVTWCYHFANQTPRSLLPHLLNQGILLHLFSLCRGGCDRIFFSIIDYRLIDYNQAMTMKGGL